MHVLVDEKKCSVSENIASSVGVVYKSLLGYWSIYSSTPTVVQKRKAWLFCIVQFVQYRKFKFLLVRPRIHEVCS